MVNIDIYTSRVCPYCIRAKSLLRSKGVKYNEFEVDGMEIENVGDVLRNRVSNGLKSFAVKNVSLIVSCDLMS